MTWTPQPRTQKPQKTSIEAFEPTADAQKREPERTPETAAETHEAGRMKVKAEAAHGRTDIAINKLEERTKGDQETPELINSINFSESAEAQRQKLNRLRTVSIVMLGTALARHPDLEKRVDISTFENIPLLGSAILDNEHMNPSHNAAFRKLQEMRIHINSLATRDFKQEWPEIVRAARDVSRNISDLSQINPLKPAESKPEAKKEGGFWSSVANFPSKHPLAFVGILAGCAFVGYKIFSGSEKAGESSDGKKSSNFWKWALGGIGAAVLGLFGFSQYLGKDGLEKFVKDKLGWKNVEQSRLGQAALLIADNRYGEAIDLIRNGADENLEFHDKMAKRMNREMKKEVTGTTLFQLKNEEFEDFIGGTSQTIDTIGKSLTEHLGFLGELPFIDTQKENEEQIAVRGFLKKHESEIRRIMVVRKETKIFDVLKKLAEHSGDATENAPDGAIVAGAAAATGAAGAAAGAASETPHTATAQTENIEGDTPEIRRDRSIEHLSTPEKKKRAMDNEKVLLQKISVHEVEEAKSQAKEKEDNLRGLVTENLKPDERKEAEQKLRELVVQRQQIDILAGKHAEALAAYEATLSQDSDEETISLRFTELIKAKENLEEKINETFDREGWEELIMLAATHKRRFVITAYRRWIKAGDLKNEHANYLFTKFKNKLSPARLAESMKETLKRGPKLPPPSIDVLRRRSDRLLKKIPKFLKEIREESQGEGQRKLQIGDFEQYDEFEAKFARQQGRLEALWMDKQNTLREAIQKGNKTEQKRLLQELREIGKERVRLEFGAAKSCGNAFERWRSAFRGSGDKRIYEQGINRMRSFFRRAVKQGANPSEDAPSVSKVLLKKGRLVFLAGSIILGGEALADEKTSRTKAYAQAGLSALPVVGTYMDFYSAATGEEKMTGRKLGVRDRALAAVFGATGLVCDALSVFGIGFAGRAALTGIKAGRGMSKAAKVAKLLGKARTPEEMAGMAKTGEKIANMQKIAFRVSLGTALAGTAFMAFTEEADLPVSGAFQKEVIEGQTDQI